MEVLFLGEQSEFGCILMQIPILMGVQDLQFMAAGVRVLPDVLTFHGKQEN